MASFMSKANKANRLLKNISRLRLPGRSLYHNEKKILAGRVVECRNDRPSILFGTIHKAASVYVWGSAKKSRETEEAEFDQLRWLLLSQRAAGSPIIR